MTKSRSNLITLLLAFAGCAVALLLTVEHYTKIDIGCTKTGGGCTSTLNSSYGHVGPIPTSLFGLGMYLAFVALSLLRGKLLKQSREAELASASVYASAATTTQIQTDTTDSKTDAEDVSNGEISTNHSPNYSTEGAASSYALVPSTPPPSSSIKSLDALMWGLAVLGFGISLWLQYVAIYQLRSFCPYCFTSACLVTLLFVITSWDYLIDGRKLNGEQKMMLTVMGFIAVLCGFLVVPEIMEVIRISKYPPIVRTTPDSDRDILLQQNHYVKGNPNAKFTLVEFADYMCEHCAKAAPIVDDILKRYPNDFKLVFRNYPLPIPTHKWSRMAAASAEAAGKQGKFWEMHDKIFKHQPDMMDPLFKEETFDKWAKELELDVDKFKEDRNSPDIKTWISIDGRDAERTRVASTPTIFFIAPNFVVSFAGTEELLNYVSDPAKWNAAPPEKKYQENRR